MPDADGRTPVAARLRRLLDERGLTLQEIGETAGLTRQAIHAIVSGRSPSPHVGTVERIVEAAGATMAELYGADVASDEEGSAEFRAFNVVLGLLRRGQASRVLGSLNRAGYEPPVWADEPGMADGAVLVALAPALTEGRGADVLAALRASKLIG
jgi:transcriptional regulator with XRE-family HTH domain